MAETDPPAPEGESTETTPTEVVTASADGEVTTVSTDDATANNAGGGDDDSEDDEDAGESSERCQLEDFTKCSECHLWKLMMSFYDRKGPESWSQGIVPHFITCNAFIGRSYARTLHGFMRDSMSPNSPAPLDPSQPLYVFELGTGSGKFSFFMLKALQEMAATSAFPYEKIVYVMTDFTQANFDFWAEHPALREYVESGNLDFAIFNATEDREITLARSGVKLEPGSCANPICIVANYLFDTLYHDIFQVDGGKLKEGLVSTGSRRAEEPDPLDPEIIKRLDNKFQYNDIPDTYYDATEEGDALHFQRLLGWYREKFGEDEGGASILVPIGALRALRRLTAFSGGRCLCISGDKGHNSPEQFRGLMDPHIAVHGSFSVMVNYHAIGLYFTSRGGFTLNNPQEEASLKVAAFVLTGDGNPCPGAGDEGDWTGDSVVERDEARAATYPHLRESFSQNIESFGPNDFFVMQKCLKEDAPTPSLKSIVALLKLGDWDPDVFYKFRDTILDQVPTAGHKLRNDLCRGIPRVWTNYYLLDKDKDIAFEIGRFYYGIREYAKALDFYQDSSDNIGEHHVTHHNMGLCHYSIGELDKALECFEESLRMNADYEKAQSWRDRVKEEMNPTPKADDGPTEATDGEATDGGNETEKTAAEGEAGGEATPAEG